MKVITLNPAQFPLVYDQGLRAVCVQESTLQTGPPPAKAMALFTDEQTNRNFVAYIEGVTYLPSSGGCTSWYVITVGQPLCDVEMAEEGQTSGISMLAYYKQLNGQGYWVEDKSKFLMVPAMIQYAGPGGDLIFVGQQVLKLKNHATRPGGWWVEEASNSTNAQPQYALHWKKGQYKNYLNQ